MTPARPPRADFAARVGALSSFGRRPLIAANPATTPEGRIANYPVAFRKGNWHFNRNAIVDTASRIDVFKADHDWGAVQMSTITITNLTDTPVAGETDLRQAVAEAKSGDTIVLASGDFGELI